MSDVIRLIGVLMLLQSLLLWNVFKLRDEVAALRKEKEGSA